MRTLLFVLMAINSLSSFSQGFQVKELKQNVNDGSAFHAPLDSSGAPCGLVKVRTDNPDLQFSGSIVGEVENKLNEYWVFLEKGSGEFNVLHPNFLPLHVEFNAFGIDRIESKATYVLTLRETKYKKEKCGLTLTVKPENAQLTIDDITIDNLSGHGFYQLFLPKGEHVCCMSLSGYRPQTQIVSSGKESQILSVELESIMANLQIKCKSGTAEIYIDGELKGNGIWNGDVLPGSHHIEARQKNYVSQILDITLEVKESRTISIPELKRSKGKLRITTNLPKLPVLLDGEFVGFSPCEIETETGEHYVSCNTFGFMPYRSNIEVNSENVTDAKLTLVFDSNYSYFEEDYYKAYRGDIKAMSALAVNRMLHAWCAGGENPEEAVFWRERIEEIDNRYFSTPSMEEDAEGWLWTYEALGDEYAKKGEKEKAIHCYQKCLTLNIKFDEYTEPETKDYKNRITRKINAL